MTEILDFEKHAASENIPLSKDRMVEIVEELSCSDDISDYLDSTVNAISNLIAIRDILSASNTTRREELIGRLGEEQLEIFSNLIINLSAYVKTQDEIRYVDGIVRASYSREEICEANIERAHKLLSVLVGRDEAMESLKMDLFNFSQLIFYLACIFTGYKNKKNDPSWVNEIAKLGELNIHNLIAISETIIKTRFSFVPKCAKI